MKMIDIAGKYKMMFTIVWADGTKTTKTVAENASFEECQRFLEGVYGCQPNQIIEVEPFGKVCIEGFKEGRAYEVLPDCPPEQKCYYHFHSMK